MLNYKFLIMDNQKRIDKGNVKLSTHNSKLKTASMSDSADTSCPLQGRSKNIPSGRKIQINRSDDKGVKIYNRKYSRGPWKVSLSGKYSILSSGKRFAEKLY